LKVLFTDHGWEEYQYWSRQDDRKQLDRINDLIESARRTPFQGLGKPEPLKKNLAGFWSRRITGEHRLVYAVEGKGEQQCIIIVQCQYHY